MALLRRSTLKDWPPRYSEEPPAEAPVQGSVDEAEEPSGGTEAAPRKRRVRSLLKPERPRRQRTAAG